MVNEEKVNAAVRKVIDEIGDGNLEGFVFVGLDKKSASHVASSMSSMSALGQAIVGLILSAGAREDWSAQQLAMMLTGITADVMRSVTGGQPLFRP